MGDTRLSRKWIPRVSQAMKALRPQIIFLA